MLDFYHGEKLFVEGLDPNNPDRRMGAIYRGQTEDGRVIVEVPGRAIRHVVLSEVYKEPKVKAG